MAEGEWVSEGVGAREGCSPRTVSSLLTSRRADSHLEPLLVRAVTDLRVMRSVHAEPRGLLFVWE